MCSPRFAAIPRASTAPRSTPTRVGGATARRSASAATSGRFSWSSSSNRGNGGERAAALEPEVVTRAALVTAPPPGHDRAAEATRVYAEMPRLRLLRRGSRPDPSGMGVSPCRFPWCYCGGTRMIGSRPSGSPVWAIPRSGLRAHDLCSQLPAPSSNALWATGSTAATIPPPILAGRISPSLDKELAWAIGC